MKNMNDLNSNAESAESHLDTGSALSDQGDYESAISEYNKALDLNPSLTIAYFTYFKRGNAKDKIELYFEAISDYDAAIRLRLDDAGAYNNRGIMKVKLGHPETAITDFDEAIRLNPKNIGAYASRGIANRDLGRADDAKRDLQTALNLADQAGDEELKAYIMGIIKRLED